MSSFSESELTSTTGLLVKNGQPVAHEFRVISHSRDPRRFSLFVYEKSIVSSLAAKAIAATAVVGDAAGFNTSNDQSMAMPFLAVPLTADVHIAKGRAAMWSFRYRLAGARKVTEWHVSGCSNAEFVDKLMLAQEITVAANSRFRIFPAVSDFDWLWKFNPVVPTGSAGATVSVSLEEAETSAFKSFQTLVLTWNVAGRLPPATETEAATGIMAELAGVLARYPGVELVAVCLQETCELNASNALVMTSENGLLWTEFFVVALGGATLWSVLGTETLVGLTLVVLQRSTSRLRIMDTSIAWSKVKTGFSGLVGNKGAVSVRLELESRATVAFSNVHFTSGDGQEAVRRKELARLVSGTRFTVAAEGGREGGGLLENDLVIVAGDWNSRTVAEVGDELKTWQEETAAAGSGAVGAALTDALLFEEAPFDFPATYKLVVGVEGVYETNRRPGWCDRVLHRATEGVRVGVLRYDSLVKVVWSDHTPVYVVAEVELVREKHWFEKRRSVDL